MGSSTQDRILILLLDPVNTIFRPSRPSFQAGEDAGKLWAASCTSLVCSGRKQRGGCPQPLKNAQQCLDMILWEHLLPAGMEWARGQKRLIARVRGGEKGNRLCSQPALVPLCSLSVDAAGWDGSPADEWDVGGFALSEVSLTRVSIPPWHGKNILYLTEWNKPRSASVESQQYRTDKNGPRGRQSSSKGQTTGAIKGYRWSWGKLHEVWRVQQEEKDGCAASKLTRGCREVC